jgi:hypothetical protein
LSTFFRTTLSADPTELLPVRWTRG